MPAAVSAARRLRPEVLKNSSTALSSNEGELARSITTSAPAMASLSPSPVMVLTPVLGEAARTSWPPLRRMATVFEPIRPVPPMTTMFLIEKSPVQGFVHHGIGRDLARGFGANRHAANNFARRGAQNTMSGHGTFPKCRLGA